MPQKLVVLYGLPGSGKTTLIKNFRSRGFQIFDDFMAESMRHQPGFLYCRHLGDIVSNLRSGTQTIIADIRLCDIEFRKEVSSELCSLVPSLCFQWHCFDCRTSEVVDICRFNVHHRAKLNDEDESGTLKRIDKFAPMFSVEPQAFMHTVERAS